MTLLLPADYATPQPRFRYAIAAARHITFDTLRHYAVTPAIPHISIIGCRLRHFASLTAIGQIAEYYRRATFSPPLAAATDVDADSQPLLAARLRHYAIRRHIR